MTLPRVFATRDLPGGALLRLGEKSELDVWDGPGGPDPDQLRGRARDCEGLLCALTERIDRALLDACPRLRVVSSCSVGLDHIDLAAAQARGIAVGFTPGVLVDATADLTFALLLAAGRRIVEADRFLRDGGWTRENRWDPQLLLGRELAGSVLGLVGLGAIGRAVARRAQGFGMRVVGWNRTPREVPGVELRTLDETLRAADFLSIHVALTDDTRDLIGAGQIARMPVGAVLVNTARGGILDESALVGALEDGRLAAAALDVFEREPLPMDSPLLRAPNLVLAPHIGSATTSTRARMADLAVDNLLAGLEGRALPRDALA